VGLGYPTDERELRRGDQLPHLGGMEAWARDVNDTGSIVGESKVSTGQVHAAMWLNGTFTDLGALLQATSSNAEAVSDTARGTRRQ